MELYHKALSLRNWKRYWHQSSSICKTCSIFRLRKVRSSRTCVKRFSEENSGLKLCSEKIQLNLFNVKENRCCACKTTKVSPAASQKPKTYHLLQSWKFSELLKMDEKTALRGQCGAWALRIWILMPILRSQVMRKILNEQNRMKTATCWVTNTKISDFWIIQWLYDKFNQTRS